MIVSKGTINPSLNIISTVPSITPSEFIAREAKIMKSTMLNGLNKLLMNLLLWATVSFSLFTLLQNIIEITQDYLVSRVLSVFHPMFQEAGWGSP